MVDELNVCSRLAELLLKNNISAPEMSTELGISGDTIQHIINGQYIPTLKELCCICEYLRIPAGELFCEDTSQLTMQSKRVLTQLNQLTAKQYNVVMNVIDCFIKK